MVRLFFDPTLRPPPGRAPPLPLPVLIRLRLNCCASGCVGIFCFRMVVNQAARTIARRHPVRNVHAPNVTTPRTGYGLVGALLIVLAASFLLGRLLLFADYLWALLRDHFAFPFAIGTPCEPAHAGRHSLLRSHPYSYAHPILHFAFKDWSAAQDTSAVHHEAGAQVVRRDLIQAVFQAGIRFCV